jgi:steroid 5-alpha reductase family enzyme
VFSLFSCSNHNNNPNNRQIILTVLDLIWSLRLSSFLFYRVIKFESDSRFDETREDCLKFLYFWIFQMFWVWIVSLPIIWVNTTENAWDLNAGDYVGFVMAIIGFSCEAWADQSKLFFK